MRTNDNIYYKLKYLKGLEEYYKKNQVEKRGFWELFDRIVKTAGRSYKTLWPLWMDIYWNKDITGFLKNNYLFGIATKNGMVSDKEKLNEEWFLDIIKIIVQRSYRIEYKVQEQYNDKQKEDLQNILKYLFKECGILQTEWDLNII